MSVVLGVLAIIFMLGGVVFLFAAALGVLRFPDPLQRMHAATKAGTAGAGLMLIGAMLALARTDATIIGLLAVVFLVLTVPVAGHLLGRAAYISGCALLGVEGKDALKGVLARHDSPLEQRTLDAAETETLPGMDSETEKTGLPRP